MAFEDLTLISCSYGTPLITLTMLKSFVAMHGDGPHNLLLMENSQDEETVNLLEQNNVPYIRNKGFTHSKAVDLALKLCKTKYALLVDTDIIFEKPIDGLFEAFKSRGATMMGTICSDRGKYKLKPRVHPWYCFINVENVQAKSINFYRPEDPRIVNTNSTAFYNNVPENRVWSSNEFYDVGSTFYEDIVNNGLKIINAAGIENFYTHYEGSSWYIHSADTNVKQAGREKNKRYAEHEVGRLAPIDVNNSFVRRMSKISMIQPIFAPDDNMFDINIRSVKSLVEYFKNNRYDNNMNFVFGGYCKSDKHWSMFNELFKELGDIVKTDVKLIRFDKNYGKAYIVNNLYDQFGKDCEFIFTMDSDIVFDLSCKDMFARLVNSARLYEVVTLKPFGLFGLDQHEANYHWHDQFDKKINIGGLNISFNSNGPGIAGGCLFISNYAWNKVGKYKVNGVYSGDDGALMLGMINEKFLMGVTLDLYIIHPEQVVSEKYLKWKSESLKRNITTANNIEDEIKIFENDVLLNDSDSSVKSFNVADKLIGR